VQQWYMAVEFTDDPNDPVVASPTPSEAVG